MRRTFSKILLVVSILTGASILPSCGGGSNPVTTSQETVQTTQTPEINQELVNSSMKITVEKPFSYYNDYNFPTIEKLEINNLDELKQHTELARRYFSDNLAEIYKNAWTRIEPNFVLDNDLEKIISEVGEYVKDNIWLQDGIICWDGSDCGTGIYIGNGKIALDKNDIKNTHILYKVLMHELFHAVGIRKIISPYDPKVKYGKMQNEPLAELQTRVCENVIGLSEENTEFNPYYYWTEAMFAIGKAAGFSNLIDAAVGNHNIDEIEPIINSKLGDGFYDELGQYFENTAAEIAGPRILHLMEQTSLLNQEDINKARNLKLIVNDGSLIFEKDYAAMDEVRQTVDALSDEMQQAVLPYIKLLNTLTYVGSSTNNTNNVEEIAAGLLYNTSSAMSNVNPYNYIETFEKIKQHYGMSYLSYVMNHYKLWHFDSEINMRQVEAGAEGKIIDGTAKLIVYDPSSQKDNLKKIAEYTINIQNGNASIDKETFGTARIVEKRIDQEDHIHAPIY